MGGGYLREWQRFEDDAALRWLALALALALAWVTSTRGKSTVHIANVECDKWAVAVREPGRRNHATTQPQKVHSMRKSPPFHRGAVCAMGSTRRVSLRARCYSGPPEHPETRAPADRDAPADPPDKLC